MLRTIRDGLEIRARSVAADRTGKRDFVDVVSEEARRQRIPENRIAAWRSSLPPDLVEAANRGEFNGHILSTGLLYPSYWADSLDVEGSQAARQWATMVALLVDIITRARALGLPVGVILTPTPFQYDGTYGSDWKQAGTTIKPEWLKHTKLETRLTEWTEDYNVPFLNLTPYFRRAAEEKPGVLNYRFDNHWTAQGHQLAASVILEWINKQGLIPGL